MDLVTVADVRAAAAAIADRVVRTPLLAAPWAETADDDRLWLKPESLQPIGAFKIRGAANAVAKLPAGTAGVITHSSGNHGRALAQVARAAGLPCVVVIPRTAPAVKVHAVRAAGAEVVLVDRVARQSTVRSLSAERGLTVIPPFDHPDVIAGQGTIGLEIVQDLPAVDTVLVPVGGGGLASGVATAITALSPDTRVIGVEPELAAQTTESLAAGQVVTWPDDRLDGTMADGVLPSPSPLTLAHMSARLSGTVTVTEEQIGEAVTRLAGSAKLVAEPSGALTTAAFLHRRAGWGSTVAVISGGNIDPTLLAKLVGGH